MNPKPEYITYILFSKTIDTFYIGYTKDNLNQRLRKHNTNHKGFTGKAKDWNVVYFEVFNTKTEALEREKMIKGWKSRKMITNLINSRTEHPD
jgi:putative endonuclease